MRTIPERPVRRRVAAGLIGVAALVAPMTGCTTAGDGTRGSPGAVPALSEADAGLPGHTVFRPRDLATLSRPLPVVVWGNGGCLNIPVAAHGAFLVAFAARGVLVLADGGATNALGTSTAQSLRASIDFAVRENTRPGSKYQGKIDTARISAQGMSCGGLNAVTASVTDNRIRSTALWDSGIFPTGGLGGATKDMLERLPGPTLWVVGGPTDIAYPNAVDDYAKVPARTPAILASYGNVGHAVTQVGPAEMPGVIDVARAFIDASLYDDAAAKARITGPDCGVCTGTKWTVQSKNWS